MTNNLPLENQIIFITGATSGFGEAAARLLSANGAKLIITGRRLEKLEKLKNELGASRVYAAKLDVTSNNEVVNVIKNLPSEFSNINALINNAGGAIGLEPAYQCSLEDWDRMIDTNIKGLTYCTRAILPSMVKRNNGYIINIGSIAGNYAYPNSNVYGACKAFVHHFSLNLRSDLAGTKVRVTSIAPGIAETEFSIVRFKGDKDKAKKIYEKTEALTANDIAETILWCLTRPEHVNINNLEIMPTSQSFGPLTVTRE
jgi:3-hydroxy acid dehydrogenase/malonic semialdehyde reductase